MGSGTETFPVILPRLKARKELYFQYLKWNFSANKKIGNLTSKSFDTHTTNDDPQNSNESFD